VRGCGAAGEIITQIEAIGWPPDTINHVSVTAGMGSRDKEMSSGQRTAVTRQLLPVTIFRCSDQVQPAPAPAPVASESVAAQLGQLAELCRVADVAEKVLSPRQRRR
jgi:hypothetical protein